VFTQGQIYKRSDIQDRFGGQRQGGISTPANSPIILVFTSTGGEQFGYRDDWHSGIFYYTGEGQIDDMQFKCGNKAIRDHADDGRLPAEIIDILAPRKLQCGDSVALCGFVVSQVRLQHG
jgi:5-methylcytosine-specific restriction protein A